MQTLTDTEYAKKMRLQARKKAMKTEAKLREVLEKFCIKHQINSLWGEEDGSICFTFEGDQWTQGVLTQLEILTVKEGATNGQS